MKIEILKKVEYDVKYLKASMGVRYWEDAVVNDIEDEHGSLIPLKNGDRWEILIDVDTGTIQNWPLGTTASVHYKVCDDGTYQLLDENKEVVYEIEDYVPYCFCTKSSGYGDYVIMDIDGFGIIDNWKPKSIVSVLREEED